MPVPIVCSAASLRQYFNTFRSCFGKRQWKYFVTVLLGLIECEDRRTLSALLRTVARPVSLSGLSRFLSRWSWDPHEVAHRWMERFREQLSPCVQAEHRRQRRQQPKRRGRPPGTVVTGFLILDDSTQHKSRGRKMEGLGHHYCGAEKRVVPGHSLFAGLYLLLGRRCPLLPRLYRRKVECQKETAPFQSKIEMAIETIRTFEPVAGTHTHVLTDSWFHCKAVRKAARERGFHMSGGLKSNRKIRLRDAEGRTQWLALSEYAAGLSDDDWKKSLWPTQDGGHPIWVHVVATWVRKLGPSQVVLTKRHRDDPLRSVRYWASSWRDASAEALLEVLATRWNIEVFFEDAKDLLGSDHYQVLRAEAVVRWWTLIACLGCFLDERRTSLPNDDRPKREEERMSWGQVRRALQAEHRENLLRWLQRQFLAGVSVETLTQC